MSRLTDLIQAAKRLDPQLGTDLESELSPLQRRLPFGLNFERHQPEAVELPGHPIRKGSKVRVLPPRGSNARGERQLWTVESVDDGQATITERAKSEPETRQVPVADLILVAEFRDPIYPGLTPTGTVARGGDKPFHTVINGENFHALELLTFTHRNKIDAIFIDPPYNTRADDWKYNNDYVDPDDEYAHSRWLAFMERRLMVAKRLMNPERSALIVTIDEKEYLRLGLLLEQVFPEAQIQMVTSIISAKGAVRRGQFSRVEEHLFFVTLGDAQIQRWSSNMLPSYREEEAEAVEEDEAEEPPQPIEWIGLRRREPSSVRGARPNQFYAIFVDQETGALHSIGDPLDDEVDRHGVPIPAGTKALWPLKPNGAEMLWGLTPDALRRIWADGFARVRWNRERGTGTVYYLPSGTIEKIGDGRITVTGRAQDGSVVGYVTPDASATAAPKRVWHMRSHNSETGGTNLLSALLPGRAFPYPKSLYAVEDALRFVVGQNKDAIILDFFAGSGTTAHATMRLNRQDGGRRQCILVTNNEVSAAEERSLRADGLRPGDSEWEQHGICDWITKPRVRSAILGQTPEEAPIPSRYRYRFVDEFPMVEGFEENAAFFTLTYESPWMVGVGRAYEAIAPLLWMRSGAEGSLAGSLDDGWAIADTYAVLQDLDRATDFVALVRENEAIRVAFVVTDDERRYQFVADDLPSDVETVRLYEDYLRNFAIAVDA